MLHLENIGKPGEEPISTAVREMVLEIMEIAMKYNCTSTACDCTDDKPTFIVEFSGVNCTLQVYCFSKGYEKDAKIYHCGDFYIKLCKNNRQTVTDIIKQLKAAIADMDRYYAEWYNGTMEGYTDV